MGAKTNIGWTDATWIPIRAKNPANGKTGWYCEHVSPGCKNCYAERLNLRHGNKVEFKPGNRQAVRMILDDKLLIEPLTWKKPRMIFVCSMTDLFGDFVTDEWIDRMFAVMALTPQHTYQILTKRSARMRDYMLETWQPTKAKTLKFSNGDKIDMPAAKVGEDRSSKVEEAMEEIFNLMPSLVDTENPDLWDEKDSLKSRHFAWPLPNVWKMVSCEDQERADLRIPDLLATPAAVRGVSYEPALGPIDFTKIPTMQWRGAEQVNALTGDLQDFLAVEVGYKTEKIDWIIFGGESGPRYRKCEIEWAYSTMDQCITAGTKFFFKQDSAFRNGQPGRADPALKAFKEFPKRYVPPAPAAAPEPEPQPTLL